MSFGRTTMTLMRELYDGSGEIMDEIEIHIDVSYCDEERETWDSPGSPAECEIVGCVDDSGNKIELTLCEEEYVSKNIWKHLRELQADAEIEDYESRRKSGQW